MPLIFDDLGATYTPCSSLPQLEPPLLLFTTSGEREEEKEFEPTSINMYVCIYIYIYINRDLI